MARSWPCRVAAGECGTRRDSGAPREPPYTTQGLPWAACVSVRVYPLHTPPPGTYLQCADLVRLGSQLLPEQPGRLLQRRLQGAAPLRLTRTHTPQLINLVKRVCRCVWGGAGGANFEEWLRDRQRGAGSPDKERAGVSTQMHAPCCHVSCKTLPTCNATPDPREALSGFKTPLPPHLCCQLPPPPLPGLLLRAQLRQAAGNGGDAPLQPRAQRLG